MPLKSQVYRPCYEAYCFTALAVINKSTTSTNTALCRHTLEAVTVNSAQILALNEYQVSDSCKCSRDTASSALIKAKLELQFQVAKRYGQKSPDLCTRAKICNNLKLHTLQCLQLTVQFLGLKCPCCH